MRRVLVLINNSTVGGAERRMGRLFARMVNEDATTALVINAALWEKLVTAEMVQGGEPRVWRLPEPCRWLAERLGLKKGASFWLRKCDYLIFSLLCLVRYGMARQHLFHALLGGPYILLPLMMLRPDHRVVISAVSADLSLHVGQPWALPFYIFCARHAHVLDALTETAKEDLIRRQITADKIMVAPGSVVDLERFQPEPEKQPWVVFAGRLIEEKNPLLFLETIPRVLEAVPAARFFVLGDGPLRSLVERQVKEMQLNDFVQIGFYPDIAMILGKTTVFVSLQRVDNYPSQSLLEAMACGVATVATDVGETWRLIDEMTGMRVKPGSAEIGQAVISLLRNPVRCAAMGISARQRIIERHSEAAYQHYLTNLYNRVWAA